MTTYTFQPQSSSQHDYLWHDPTIWVPTTVPNAPDADVIVPVVTQSGTPFVSAVTFTSESFGIRSLSVAQNSVAWTSGTLSVGDSVSLLAGGSIGMNNGILTAASMTNMGGGISAVNSQITVAGAFSTAGSVAANGLTITAQQFSNTASILSTGGGLTVNVTGGGFDGTLQGGGYSGNNIKFNFGSVITATAAAIAGSGISSFDTASSSYVPIASTLTLITPSGSLSFFNFATFNWVNPLTDNGHIRITDFSTLNVPQLTVNGDLVIATGSLVTPDLIIGSDGTISGGGTINGSISNAGVISAGSLGNDGPLIINGSVTGPGHLVIHSAPIANRFPAQSFGKLEVTGPVSQDVVFDDERGTLTLDDPTHFTGSIKPIAGDKVVLSGIGLSSITSYSYTGDSHGGTLTLQQSSGHLDVKFTGAFDTQSFTVSAGPSAPMSPPSITISGFTPAALPPFPTNPGNVDEWILKDGDGHWAASAGPGSHPAGFRVAAVADFTGDGFADILWQNVNTGAVDLWKMKHGAWNGSVDIGIHPGAGWQIAGAGDFNHDGTSDVFWFNPSTGETDIWQLANGQWAASVSPGNHPAGYQVAGIADFNHDGTSDVLWFNPTTRHVDEWNIVNGHWAGSNSIGNYPDAGFQIAGVGDFNHDGTGDVFWYNPGTGATDIWLLQNGHWSASVSPGNHPTGWNVAGIGDINGDGTSDVVWYNPSTGNVDEWKIANGHWAGSIDLGAHPGSGWAIAGLGDFSGGGTPTSDILWHQFV